MNRLALFGLVAGFALASGGCGSDPEPEATQSAAPSTEQRAAPAQTVNDPTARMARAVGDGKPGAAVELRYDFASKPEVGVPTEVAIAFIPRAGVDALDATISGMDGITVAGSLKAHFDQVESGKAYEHKVSLLPERAGVFYITVEVTTTLGGATVGRTYSIPFVAGAPAAQRKAEPPKDASGQAVESMKAEETSG